MKEVVIGSNLKRIDNITSIIYLREYLKKNFSLLDIEEFKKATIERIIKIKEIHSHCRLTQKISEELLEEIKDF